MLNNTHTSPYATKGRHTTQKNSGIKYITCPDCGKLLATLNAGGSVTGCNFWCKVCRTEKTITQSND